MPTGHWLQVSWSGVQGQCLHTHCPPGELIRCARSVSLHPLPSRWVDSGVQGQCLYTHCPPVLMSTCASPCLIGCTAWVSSVISDSHALCILQVSWLRSVRLVSMHSSCPCGTEIVSSLWERFMKILCCFNCLSNLVFYTLSTIMAISGR